jgi:hypothetical protein
MSPTTIPPSKNTPIHSPTPSPKSPPTSKSKKSASNSLKEPTTPFQQHHINKTQKKINVQVLTHNYVKISKYRILHPGSYQSMEGNHKSNAMGDKLCDYFLLLLHLYDLIYILQSILCLWEQK